MRAGISPRIGLSVAARPQYSAEDVSYYRPYVEALEAAGAQVVLIPYLPIDELRSLYRSLQGLLLPGGDDVHPSEYGEEAHPALGEVDRELDRVELALAHWSLSEEKPVLGICRGCQVLNVAAGGSLWQDLPSQRPDAIPHRRRDLPRHDPVHLVEVKPGSRLHGIIGVEQLGTNSRHHQAVKDIASGLVKVAWSQQDGVVEGIEHPGHPFAVAVQWHPEDMWRHAEPHARLFRALVEAALRGLA